MKLESHFISPLTHLMNLLFYIVSFSYFKIFLFFPNISFTNGSNYINLITSDVIFKVACQNIEPAMF